MMLRWDSPVVDVDFPIAPQAAAPSRAKRPQLAGKWCALIRHHQIWKL